MHRTAAVEKVSGPPAREAAPQIPWSLGTLIQLELGDQKKATCVLVGADQGDYLVVRGSEQLGGMLTKFLVGHDLVVRCVIDGVIYTFSSTFLEVLLHPRRLALLRYPKTFKTHNLRSSKRVECNLPAKIDLAGSRCSAIITDLSIGGCRLVIRPADDPPPAPSVGMPIATAVGLPGASAFWLTRGEVRAAQSEGGTLTLGVAFKDMARDARAAISTYLATMDD